MQTKRQIQLLIVFFVYAYYFIFLTESLGSIGLHIHYIGTCGGHGYRGNYRDGQEWYQGHVCQLDHHHRGEIGVRLLYLPLLRPGHRFCLQDRGCGRGKRDRLCLVFLAKVIGLCSTFLFVFCSFKGFHVMRYYSSQVTSCIQSLVKSLSRHQSD